MAINSREKGKAGEREFAALCRKYGFENVRRGQQFSGIEGKDVVGLEGIHIEVKRVERLNIDEAMKQAIRDSKEGEIPIVAHRRNREEWKVTMRAEDWLEFYKALRDRMGQKNLRKKKVVIEAIPYRNFKEKMAITKQFYGKAKIEIYKDYVYVERAI